MKCILRCFGRQNLLLQNLFSEGKGVIANFDKL